jgi:hypothetical protein
LFIVGVVGGEDGAVDGVFAVQVAKGMMM